jgi:hypothetical protein
MEENSSTPKLVFSSDENIYAKYGKDKYHSGSHHSDHRDFNPYKDIYCPSVPEPSTYTLLIVGLIFTYLFYRNRSKFTSRNIKVGYKDIL